MCIIFGLWWTMRRPEKLDYEWHISDLPFRKQLSPCDMTDTPSVPSACCVTVLGVFL